MNEKITRKEFLKLSGLFAAAIPMAKIVGQRDGYDLIESEEEYGGFLIRQKADGEEIADIDWDKFERFDQYNDMFTRRVWDTEYQKSLEGLGGYGEGKDKGKPGYTREILALNNSAGTIAEGLGTGDGMIGKHQGLYALDGLNEWGYDERWDHSHLTSEELTTRIKTVARFYGASLVGIAKTNPNWFYSKYSHLTSYETMELERAEIRFEPGEKAEYLEDGTLLIPDSYQSCIVLAVDMDYEAVNLSPTTIASGATGVGYSKQAFSAALLAEYIRNLGYGAVPCGNNTGLSVPLAIEAGIGEKSRSGLLVTPKYGPRVRLSKVYTDMPLDHDKPISFGVEEFCKVCKKCAEHCPSGAIKDEEQTYVSDNISNIQGVKKWHQDVDKCARFWAENGSDCSNCIAVCPFNKPDSWLHEITRILIGAKSGPIDRLLVNLDTASGYGGPPSEENILGFWNKDNFMHIKD